MAEKRGRGRPRWAPRNPEHARTMVEALASFGHTHDTIAAMMDPPCSRPVLIERFGAVGITADGRFKAFGMPGTLVPDWELYDVERDPAESRPLDNRARANELIRQWLVWDAKHPKQAGAMDLRAWFLVFFALLLNYFGQGAFLITHPDAKSVLFGMIFYQAKILYVPFLILSIIATVIASGND